jgi:hypothetical protein
MIEFIIVPLFILLIVGIFFVVIWTTIKTIAARWM